MSAERAAKRFQHWFTNFTEDGFPPLPDAMAEQYTMTRETLGYGTFAVVMVCVTKTTGTKRAVKIIARKPLCSAKDHDNVEVLPARLARDEIQILLNIHHPNMYVCRTALTSSIRLWDFYETDDALFLVTDLCEGGELFDTIVRRVSYDEYDARIVMREVLQGVAYLHKKNIIHRDLKPENILLMKKDDINHVVISDFGLAKIMPEEGMLLTACGSPQYVAPEVLLGKGYNQQVDIWSCGVIVFALLSGYTPFYSTDVQTLFQKIVNIDYEFNPDYWSQQSEMAKDFIRKCLCEKSKRMTAAEALQHPWIEGLMVSDGKQNRGSKLKRMLDPTEPINSNNQEDTLVNQVDRMEHLQNLRRKYGTTSEAHMERLDHFLKDFKEELGDHSYDASQPKDKGKNKVNSNKVDLELHSSEGPPGTLDEHRPSGETNGTKLSYTRHYIREASSGSRAQKETKTAEVLNELLEHYRTAERPSFSRVDPTVQTRPNSSSTFERAIKMVPTLLNQGLSIGSIIASHAIYGPPKKSWGVEMSILTKTIREVSKHSDLTTIPVLQKVFDLARFLPVPEDGLVTPVTFRVKRRGLRGILAESDAKETGKRELTGEWIVGKQTWRRLQSEWQNGKRTGKERVILYIHGGAYFVMSAITHRPLTIALSKYCECRVFCVNYRLAPDTIFPGALLDCVAAWFRLIDDLHIPANNIVFAADSAGGGLAIALLMYLRDNKYPLPGGAILFSPWVDLTLSCDSWETNKEFDYLPRPNDGDHMHPVAAYLGPNFDKYLTHPYVSPLFGDMHGLPPLLIQTGDAEVLRDENILFAHKCSLAGVPVRHEIYEDCVHVFQFFLFLDASRKALQSTRHFMRTALDKRPKRQASKVTADAREQLDNEMSGGMNNAQGQRVEPATGAPKGEAQVPAEENGEQLVTIKNVEPSDDESQDWALDSNSDNDKEDQEPMEQDPPSLSTSQSTEGQQSEERNIKYKDNMQAENTQKTKMLHVQSSQNEKANNIPIKNGKASSG